MALVSLQGQESEAQQDLAGIQTLLLQADCLPRLLHLLGFASSPLRCQVTPSRPLGTISCIGAGLLLCERLPPQCHSVCLCLAALVRMGTPLANPLGSGLHAAVCARV